MVAPGALATADTAGSSPPPALALLGAFDQSGFNVRDGAGPMLSGASASPSLLGSDTGVVLNEPSMHTPLSSRHSAGGSERTPKKTAGRKPSANAAVLSLPSPTAPACVGLQAALGPAGVSAKARRSRASPVAQRAPSAWAKAQLGELSSMESA